jgi:hypothetical protein
MSTSFYLSLIADELEAIAGSTSSANHSTAGYWERIALAAEDIAGITSSTNADLFGYMRRAALAIVSRTAFSSPTFDSSEIGYLAQMAAALEFSLSTTTTGSYEYRLYTLLLSWSGTGVSGDELLLSGDMGPTDYLLLSGDMQSGGDHVRI